MATFNDLIEAAASEVVLANSGTPLKMLPLKKPPTVKEKNCKDKKGRKNITKSHNRKSKQLDFRRKSPRFTDIA